MPSGCRWEILEAMKKGEVFITTADDIQVWQRDRNVTLPANKVFTYKEEDAYGNIWINVDGLDCMLATSAARSRQLPYPIEKPGTIEEYRVLISKIVKDMSETFGLGVEVEANQNRVKFHLG